MFTKMRICGLDEAGRGALAGPLVVAAVVFPASFRFEAASPHLTVRDSKLLSTPQREKVYDLVKSVALDIDFAIVPVRQINKNGINWANISAFRRLIQRTGADRYIVDGKWNLCGLGVKARITDCVIDADENVPAAIAAGIAAKIKRDAIMRRLHERRPEYLWIRNTGHGTEEHIGAIRRFGATEEHRVQFVNSALANDDAKRRDRSSKS